MKYEAIKLLRQLVSGELSRTQIREGDFKSYSQEQQRQIKESHEVALSLKREIDNLEFKII